MSEVVSEKPLGTMAMGRTLAEAGVEEGEVVMYFIISRDFVCQSEIMPRYSTNASFSSGMGDSGVGTATPSLISVSAAAGFGAEIEVRREGVVSHVLTAQEVSWDRCEVMKVPISARSSLSAASTTMTAPRVSWAGLVGPGFGRGGEILVRTLILLR